MLDQTTGPAFTALSYDARVLGCAGVMFSIIPHIGIGWAVLSDELMIEHRFWTARSFKRVFDYLLKQSNVDRIECCVDVSSARDQRFAEWLGFVKVKTVVEFARKK